MRNLYAMGNRVGAVPPGHFDIVGANGSPTAPPQGRTSILAEFLNPFAIIAGIAGFLIGQRIR